MESIMGFGYHLQTMTRDIGEPINALSGAGNLAAVKAELDKLAQKDERVSEVLPHVDALDGYRGLAWRRPWGRAIYYGS